MKKLHSVYGGIRKALFCLLVTTMVACSGNKKPTENSTVEEPVKEQPVKEETASDDPMKNKGIGPVKEMALSPIDDALAAEGKALFDQLCIACHKPTEKLIGPAPKGILDRRTPEWVMNMIMNPSEMTQKDPIAMQLLKEANGVPMADQNVTEEQARKILEYFRTL